MHTPGTPAATPAVDARRASVIFAGLLLLAFVREQSLTETAEADGQGIQAADDRRGLSLERLPSV